MLNSALLKNPVLRNKMKVTVSNPVGDLIQEINEQDLGGEAGGTTPATITVLTPITPTPFAGCGRILTVSAECNGGTRCD